MSEMPVSGRVRLGRQENVIYVEIECWQFGRVWRGSYSFAVGGFWRGSYSFAWGGFWLSRPPGAHKMHWFDQSSPIHPFF